MKQNLLVTLADENFVDQAKQLFSSVYWNARWKGDYMLLAYNIPEKKLKWFRDKGILIKKCELIPDTKDLENLRRHPIVFCKFYLFTPEFKKWKNVVFLDADIIVRGSLDRLTRINKLAAPNATGINLKKCFPYSEKKNYYQLIREYPLNGNAFNSGVIAFNTKVIKEDSFSRLIQLLKQYGELNLDGDEPTINLLFYKNWKMLPLIYNLYPHDLKIRFGIEPKQVKGIIIHFVESIKPWNKDSPFNKEWEKNLKMSELIDIKKEWKKEWKKQSEIIFQLQSSYWLLYLMINQLIFYIPYQIDRIMGLIGVFIKKHNPKLYFKLKKRFF